MHHEVGVGKALVDRLNYIHRQHIAIGLTGEFVRAVAGAHSNGESIYARLGNEALCLFGIG